MAEVGPNIMRSRPRADNLERSARFSAPNPAYIGMTPHAARSTTPTSPPGPKQAPTFLTVEEAAAVLRIGRTAAYALSRQWRATGGSEGLPVVRVGRLLRVPVHELERIAGGAIDHAEPIPADLPAVEPEPPRTMAQPEPQPATRRSTRKPDQAQATLFPEAS